MNANKNDVFLAAILGGVVVLSASTVSAQCNEAQAIQADNAVVWEKVAMGLASSVVRLQITLDAERATFAVEKADLSADRERFLDEMMDAEDTASACRIKMNEVYGDPGWPVADPIDVEMDDRFMWTWELACGPFVEETTCSTCIKDLRYAQETADMLMGNCDELKAEEIADAAEGNCKQVRAEKVRRGRELHEMEQSADYWAAEATKLREKYEPEKYAEEED